MKRTIAIIPIALAGLAHAETINYLSSYRITVGFGSQESVSGTVDFNSEQSDGDGSLETWSGAAAGGVSAGGGVGRMDSIIGADFFNASGSASADATFTNNLVFARALGSSSHEIRISL